MALHRKQPTSTVPVVSRHSREMNPTLWDLLQEYERQTGELALINTSLNGPKRPIAYRAQDVLDDFLLRDVNVFVFDDVMAFRP
jgi:predicted NodU family carbamoyl transferase